MDAISELPFLEDHPSGLIITIYVQPKSSKNMIVGCHNNTLKIKLTAPPVDGAANKMCQDFLAKTFKISKSNIEILSGHAGRNKRVLIKTENPISKIQIQQQLQKYCK